MRIELKIQSLEQAKNTYDTHMQRDFPENEQKPWQSILKMHSRGIYEMTEAWQGETMVGYVWMVCPDGDSALIDYLAVLPQYRGTGVGSEILKALTDRYREKGKTLLLESEYPAEAPDPVIARRRLGFYARAGFLETGVQLRLFGVRFCILAWESSGNVTERLDHIYRAMFPGELYLQAVCYIN